MIEIKQPWVEQIASFAELHEVAGDYVFHPLAIDADAADKPVVLLFTPVAVFEGRCD